MSRRADSSEAPEIDELRGVVVCQLCSKKPKKIFQCSRCKSVYYCSRHCQKNDWRRHTQECSKLRHKRLEKVDVIVHRYKRLNVEKHYTVKTHKNMTVGDLMAGLSQVMGIKDSDLEFVNFRINPTCLKKKYKRVAGEFDNTYSMKKLWEFNLLEMFQSLPQFDLLDVRFPDNNSLPFPQQQEKKYHLEIVRLRKLLEKKEEEIAVLRINNEKNINIGAERDKILIEELKRKLEEKDEEMKKLIQEKEEEIRDAKVNNELLTDRILKLKKKCDSLVQYNRDCLSNNHSATVNHVTNNNNNGSKGKVVDQQQQQQQRQHHHHLLLKGLIGEEGGTGRKRRKEFLQKTVIQMKEEEEKVINSIKLKYENILKCKEEMTKTYQKSMNEIRKVQRELRREQEEYLSKSKNHMFQIETLKELLMSMEEKRD